jgi:hypothetical protein
MWLTTGHLPLLSGVLWWSAPEENTGRSPSEEDTGDHKCIK